MPDTKSPRPLVRHLSSAICAPSFYLSPHSTPSSLVTSHFCSALPSSEAKRVNLSPAEFARMAIIRALTRTVKDPQLESRAARATGRACEQIKSQIPDVPPLPDDELPA
jgi:hypothetical protein